MSERQDEMLGRSWNWLCSMFLVHVCIGRPRALKPDPCASPPDRVCCTEMPLVAFLLDTGRWQSRANGSVGGTAIIRGSLVDLQHARAFRSVGSARAERARSIGSGPLFTRVEWWILCCRINTVWYDTGIKDLLPLAPSIIPHRTHGFGTISEYQTHPSDEYCTPESRREHHSCLLFAQGVNLRWL